MKNPVPTGNIKNSIFIGNIKSPVPIDNIKSPILAGYIESPIYVGTILSKNPRLLILGKEKITWYNYCLNITMAKIMAIVL